MIIRNMLHTNYKYFIYHPLHGYYMVISHIFIFECLKINKLHTYIKFYIVNFKEKKSIFLFITENIN